MARTADVHQSIWSDPWFVDLPPDGKLLYLWAITTDHGNLAGLFTVSPRMISFETGLTRSRLAKALESLRGKLAYRESSGALWVVGRAKRVRSKTEQIAKSIARAVEECPEPDLQAAFVTKYGESAWLRGPLGDLALEREKSEPQPNLTEVPSLSISQRGTENGTTDTSAEWQDWLAHYRQTTGNQRVQGSAQARREFNARRRGGKDEQPRSLEDLKLATVGCHGDDYCRRHGHDVPETILRASKVDRYITLALGRKRGDAGLAKLAGRSA